MKCAERRPDGRSCRRTAIAAVSTRGELITLLCGDCTLRADRLVRGLVVRWLDRRPPARAGRAS